MVQLPHHGWAKLKASFPGACRGHCIVTKTWNRKSLCKGSRYNQVYQVYLGWFFRAPSQEKCFLKSSSCPVWQAVLKGSEIKGETLSKLSAFILIIREGLPVFAKINLSLPRKMTVIQDGRECPKQQLSCSRVRLLARTYAALHHGW